MNINPFEVLSKFDILCIKGGSMKKVSIFIVAIIGIFFLTLCQEETEVGEKHTIQNPKEPYMDTPINTYKERVEAQNIANTIQNPNSYLGSRIEARGSSKQVVKESNQRSEAQNKAIEDFMK